MKKIITLLTIAALCLSLCACSLTSPGGNSAEGEEENSTAGNGQNYYQPSQESSVYQSSSEQPAKEQPPTVKTGFSIEGKWKNVGEGTFGQAQKGAIIIFDGVNCNFFSPRDTYALYYSSGKYQLDCTSFLFSETLNFDVEIIDADNIEVTYKSSTVKLMRVS